MTTAQIEIKNLAFNPNSLTIEKGTTVVWTNNDSTTHTVTSTDTPPVFDSGPTDLPPSTQFQYTFDTPPGTYNYHCEIHTQMQGTIIITDNPTKTSTILLLAGVSAIGLYHSNQQQQYNQHHNHHE